jgi:WD40 repeat protein
VYTGKITISFPLICDCCRRASWSGDGSRLAVGDRKGWLAMYDATNGQQLWQGQLEFLFAQSLSLSADGNLLAVGSFDKQIRIWDFSRSDGSPKIIGGNSSVVMGSVFTHKDTRLVTGCLDGTIREYNLVTNQIIRQIR